MNNKIDFKEFDKHVEITHVYEPDKRFDIKVVGRYKDKYAYERIVSSCELKDIFTTMTYFDNCVRIELYKYYLEDN